VHSSGITVIQEAALAGIPIVATNVGGLDAYFPHDEVRYVPAADVEALRQALRTTSDPVEAYAQTRRAQKFMVDRRLWGEAYAHVELSREVLFR
jgi:glycosyltransferase involved in cell wall biosynthesis